MADSSFSESTKFLYEEIRDNIKKRIEKNLYGIDERLPSTRAFVDEFSTTPVTINRALSDLVESGHIRRIAKSGSFVNPRAEWVGGTRKQTGIVGIIAFDTKVSVYWARAAEAMQDALEAQGFHAVSVHSDHSFEKATEYVDDLVEKGIDGLIYVPIDARTSEDYQKKNEEVCRRMESYHIPFVLYDRRLNNQRFSSVTADVYKASLELTRCLAESGCKNPIYLTMDYSQALQEREKAFLENGARFGMNVSPDRMVRYRGTRVKPEETDVLLELIESAPEFDGIYIANSNLYSAFLRMEAHLGKKYDLPLVTFRDLETEQPTRPVARALQPVHDFGYTCGDLLARMLKGDIPGAGFNGAVHVVLPVPVESAQE